MESVKSTSRKTERNANTAAIFRERVSICRQK